MKLLPSRALMLGAIFTASSGLVLAEEQLLQLAANEPMEQIVVTAGRMEKKLADVAGTTSVIQQDEIERQVATDLNQLFRYDPSIEITGSVAGAQNISVRGMGGNRVLMIKDGMRMNEGYGADGLNDIVGRGFIDTSTLKQVEVAKGAASSLYGSDALGGLIVFVTKDASDYLSEGQTVGGSVGVNYDSRARQSGVTGTLALRTGGVEQLLNVSARKGEEQQNYHKKKDPFDNHSESVLYKLKWNITDEDSLSFTADAWQQHSEGDKANGLLSYFRGLDSMGYHVADESLNSKKKTKSFKINYRSTADRLLYDYLDVSLYSNTNQQEDMEFGLLNIASSFTSETNRSMWETALFKQKTVGFLSSVSKTINSVHTLGYGLDVEKTSSQRSVRELRIVAGAPNSPNNRDQVTNKFPKNDVMRYGVYLNDSISLFDQRLEITPSLRFDRYEMDPNGALTADGKHFKKVNDEHLSFNFGALYHINEQLAAYLQFGQGFKVPAYDLAYVEHDLQATSDYRYTLVPNADLKAEKSNSYELGLRGSWQSVSFSSAIFVNKFKDFLQTALINSELVSPGGGASDYIHDTFHYENVDSVTIRGAEVSVSYTFIPSLSAFANAAYQHGKDDKTKEYIYSITPLSGHLGLRYHAHNIESDLVANWAKRMTYVNSGEVKAPGYTTFDWLFSYQMPKGFQLNLAVYNLTNKKYHRHSNVARHKSSSDLRVFLEPGRTFNVGFSYNF